MPSLNISLFKISLIYIYNKIYNTYNYIYYLIKALKVKKYLNISVTLLKKFNFLKIRYNIFTNSYNFVSFTPNIDKSFIIRNF